MCSTRVGCSKNGKLSLFPTTQNELERVEEEQTLEELQSLRDIVQDWFRKQEEIAEVSLDRDSAVQS